MANEDAAVVRETIDCLSFARVRWLIIPRPRFLRCPTLVPSYWGSPD
jgi:hypothetical protein